VVTWTLGPAFAGAVVPFALMLLYPIHQSLGQVQGTFFQATGRTSTYMHIGLVTAVVNLPLTYLAFAPHDRFGLGGGATALALKMLVAQLIGVSLQARSIYRASGWPQDPWLQAAVIGVCGAAAFGVKALMTPLLRSASASTPAAVVAAACGVAYTLLVGALLWRYPAMAGLDRASLRGAVNTVRAVWA